MCIVLFTTAHPAYPLILIDNRDEYLLRPTSSPHWWQDPSSTTQILSSRDLQKTERGTWMGITRTGVLAVLTNFREPVAGDHHSGKFRSRGGVVTAWLSGVGEQGLDEGVRTLLDDGGVKGVGGFSLLCGRLRKHSDGIAVVSNRSNQSGDVPVLGRGRDSFEGLSNARYVEDEEWPKVSLGKELLRKAIGEAVEGEVGKDDLIEKLFEVLDTDTMPPRKPGMSFSEYLTFLRHTIHVPPLGDSSRKQVMYQAQGKVPLSGSQEHTAMERLLARPEPDLETVSKMFDDGMYGTQRQTVLLVDWEGKVTFVERALWDDRGREIKRGEGDTRVEFEIEGWDSE